MALTLIATPGLATSNTYATRAEADTYHESHLYATDWTGATEANQDIALVMATRLIDQHVRINGTKTASDQALQMPCNYLYDRHGTAVDSSIIPQWMIDATCEFARLLLAKNRTAEDSLRGLKEAQLGTMKVKVSTMDRVGVLPDSVWMFLKDYAVRSSKNTRILVKA